MLKPETQFYKDFRTLFEEYNEDYFGLKEHNKKQHEYDEEVTRLINEYGFSFGISNEDTDILKLYLDYQIHFVPEVEVSEDDLERQCEYADKLRELFCLRTGHDWDDDMCGYKHHSYCLNCSATAWRLGYWRVGNDYEKVLEEGQIVAIATEYEIARDLLGDYPPYPHPPSQEVMNASYAHTLAVRKVEKELIHDKIEAIVNERP